MLEDSISYNCFGVLGKSYIGDILLVSVTVFLWLMVVLFYNGDFVF